MRSLFRRLYRHSIWHPSAVEPDDFKYRNLKRVWLPLFDLLSVVIGLMAILYGSKVLNQLYPSVVIDLAGFTFLIASLAALVGLAFSRLWFVEVLGKIVMLSLLGSYSCAVTVLFVQGDVQSGFVAGMLMYPVLFPLFRLQVIGEEVKQRRIEGG